MLYIERKQKMQLTVWTDEVICIMKATNNISSFVSLDIRNADYKPSNNHRSERLKPVYAYVILDAAFIMLMLLIKTTESANAYYEAKGKASICILIGILVLLFAYMAFSELSSYKRSDYFYNSTAIYVCTLGLTIMIVAFKHFAYFFGGNIKTTHMVSIVILSFVANIILISVRVKRGFYLRQTVKLNKERIFPIVLAIMLIIRFASKRMDYVIYAGIILITFGMCYSVSFYAMQIIYAKKHGIEKLLPKVAYKNDENSELNSRI